MANINNNLGRQIRVFKVAGIKNKANRFFGKMFAWLGGLLIVAGAVCLARSSDIGWLWLGLGAVLLAGGTYALWELYADNSTQVELYERGITYQKRGKRQSIGWEDIQAIHLSARRIRLRRSSKVSFDISHGVKLIGSNNCLEFSVNKNSMPEVAELMNSIEKSVVVRQLPSATTSMEQGHTVDFGALTLSSQGIGHVGDFLKWEQLQDLKCQNGFVIVHARDQRPDGPTEWARVDQFHVANLAVFRMLVKNASQATLA